MEVLLSNRPIVQSLPDSYVLPPDRRPGMVNVPIGKDIPVIDFQTIADPDDRIEVVQQILKACQEFGLFQVHTYIFLYHLVIYIFIFRLCLFCSKIFLSKLHQ
ncbi:hypothetical protein CsSME_00002391 [Camellia sinensis var. sinensis]